jgi:hypothetical protein
MNAYDASKGTPEIDRFSAGCVRKILRVSHRTLTRWDKNGFLRALRTARGNRFYTRDQIEAFMRSTYVVKRKDSFLEYRPLGETGEELA